MGTSTDFDFAAAESIPFERRGEYLARFKHWCLDLLGDEMDPANVDVVADAIQRADTTFGSEAQMGLRLDVANAVCVAIAGINAPPVAPETAQALARAVHAMNRE